VASADERSLSARDCRRRQGIRLERFRHKLRDEGIRQVIKHGGLYSLDATYNSRIDDDVYHRRSIVETISFSLRKRFDSTTRAKTWFGQFQEIVQKAAVRNLERAVASESYNLACLNKIKGAFRGR
jgi:IS5 family transposase